MPYWTSERVAENRAQTEMMPALTEADMAPGFFGGTLTGLGLAVPGLVSRPLLAATETFNPWLRANVENTPEAFGGWKEPIVDYLDWQRANARRAAMELMPDARTVGTAGQLLYGVGTMVPEMVVASVLSGGPWGGAAYEAWVQSLNAKIRMEAAGVDEHTALIAGGIEGLFAGATAFLPGVFGALPKAILPKLGYQAATQGAANVGIGVTSRMATHAYFADNGYPEMAAQIHPFALAELGLDFAVGSIFGTAMLALHGKPGEVAPKPVPRPMPHSTETIDALTVANSAGHAELDTAPGAPLDGRAREAQREALVDATMQLYEGVAPGDVDVSRHLVDAEWGPYPPEVQRQRDAYEEAAIAALQEHEADAARATADEFGYAPIVGELPLQPPTKPEAPAMSAEKMGQDNRLALIRALKRFGGVNIDEASDVTGGTRRSSTRLMPGLFRRRESGGRGMDEVAQQLNEMGYITDAEYEGVDGGVERAREIINDLISKKPIYSVHDTEIRGEMMNAEAEAEYQTRLAAGDFNALQRGAWVTANVLDEPQRVAVTARLKKAAAALEEGRAADGKLELDLLLEDIATAKEARAGAAPTDRVRGPDWIRERLTRAARTGELDRTQAELGLWLVERNPHLAEGLAISVRGDAAQGVAGTYNNLKRLITLVSGRGDVTTAMHEILHHTERMMPPDVQAGIRAEWAKRIANIESFAQGYDVTALRRAVGDILRANMGDQRSLEIVTKGIADGVLPPDFYQYVNPSEFWAENASRIMHDRALADTFGRKAKQWMLEFVEKVKGLFGLESDSAVLAGLRNLIEGKEPKIGEFKSPGMLIQDEAKTGLRASMAGVFKSIDHTKASAEFQKLHEATLAYRARKIGDAEFLKARAEYDAYLKATEGDLLATYSNADVLTHERESINAATKDAGERKAAEQKAIADAQRDAFTLTGSDMAADTPGQQTLFDIVAPYPGTIDNPTSRETAFAIADARIAEAEANAEKAVNAAVGCAAVEGE
jgi:hypothetical protein